MTRIKFPEDFREKAVRLALSSILSRQQITDDLGVSKSTLGKWITTCRHTDLLVNPHDNQQKELGRKLIKVSRAE